MTPFHLGTGPRRQTSAHVTIEITVQLMWSKVHTLFMVVGGRGHRRRRRVAKRKSKVDQGESVGGVSRGTCCDSFWRCPAEHLPISARSTSWRYAMHGSLIPNAHGWYGLRAPPPLRQRITIASHGGRAVEAEWSERNGVDGDKCGEYHKLPRLWRAGGCVRACNPA
jgi:hypothetical protein